MICYIHDSIAYVLCMQRNEELEQAMKQLEEKITQKEKVCCRLSVLLFAY